MLYKSGHNDTDSALNNLKHDTNVFPHGLYDSELYVQLYSHQFNQLNRLIEANKACQRSFAEKMLDTEDRHARELFALKDKLENTEQSIFRTKAGFCGILEDRIRSLKAECNRKQHELERLDAVLKAREEEQEAERERQKIIILYMLGERKQLLSLVHHLKMRMKNEPNGEFGLTSNLVAELRRQLRQICEERNQLSQQCKRLQTDKTNLLGLVHELEDDLAAIKIGQVRNKVETTAVGGYVMANKTALANELPMDNTGTVRYNKWNKSSSHTMPLIMDDLGTSKNFETNMQVVNSFNGNPVQLRGFPIVNGGPNLPRSANTRSHPTMGVRGSQLRNSRPAMGVAQMRAELHGIGGSSGKLNVTTDSTGFASPRIPVSHTQSNVAHLGHITTIVDPFYHRVTKRSTSLPRRTSNGDIVITTRNVLATTENPAVTPTLSKHRGRGALPSQSSHLSGPSGGYPPSGPKTVHY